MELLLEKLGLDIRLFIAQVVNFLIVFGVIYGLVYKRLIAFMNARRAVIAQGVTDAENAKKALANIDVLKEKTLLEASETASAIATAITNKAQEKKKQILESARAQEQEVLAVAKKEALQIIEDGHEQAQKDAVAVVKKILTDVIEVAPTAVDTALIRRASKAVRIP